jgi:hypothetical protein
VNCPHCQKELPEGQGAACCPFCGKESLPEPAVGEPLLPSVKFRAQLFFTALLLPPALTMIWAAVVRLVLRDGAVNEGVSPMVGFFGAVAGGLVCGVLLGLKAGRTVPTRIICSMVFAPIFFVVCIVLCWFGCSTGGYQLSFH